MMKIQQVRFQDRVFLLLRYLYKMSLLDIKSQSSGSTFDRIFTYVVSFHATPNFLWTFTRFPMFIVSERMSNDVDPPQW